jgi:nucleoid-associated protein YgaU
MERQLPKNVKQIGNVSDEPKIYVEDYVETYLKQLQENADGHAERNAECAALIGEILQMDGQAVVFVSGAIQMKDVALDGNEIKLEEETVRAVREEQERYFPSGEIVGWCFAGAGRPIVLFRETARIHEKWFAKEYSVFVWKDTLGEDEQYYTYKYGELMQMGGHYVYYERNPAMQNYMINTRKKWGMTPSEVVTDRAAKDFRSTVRGRMVDRQKRKSSRYAYATSILLVLIVLVMGVSVLNRADKIQTVKQSLKSLVSSVATRGNQTVETESAQVEADGTADQGETAGAAAQTKADGSAEQTGTSGTADRAGKTDGSAELAETSGTADQAGKTDESAEQTETSGTADQTGETGQEKATAKTQAEDADDGQAVETVATNNLYYYGEGDTLTDEDYYIVGKGDTLDSISQQIYGDSTQVDAICRMNGLEDGNLIYIGQKLLLP